MKINTALCFRPQDLIDYLNKNLKNDTFHNELVAALIIRLMYEKVYGWRDYYIYFQPKDNRHKELIESIGTTIKLSSLKQFLEKNVEQNSPYDVLFVNPNNGEKADVRPVQIKRFGIGIKSNNLTPDFVKYLSSLSRSYSATTATLLVFIENPGKVDFKPIQEHIKLNGIPFEELVMYSIKANGDVHICQVYPVNENIDCFISSMSEVKGNS